jgi:glyoxylase-like metal-dependent hydrolase (beta-lactamase superfamily II)
MTRGLVLGLLIAAGALSMAGAAAQAPQTGLSAAAVAATKIEKVKDNLYIVTGRGIANRDAFSGGNTAVFITAAGVVIVDTKLWGGTGHPRPCGPSPTLPITTIINTHTHGDQPGSNALWHVGRDDRAGEHGGEHGQDGCVQGRQREVPAEAIYQRQDVDRGRKEQIDLLLRPCHTDGDTFVVFPR